MQGLSLILCSPSSRPLVVLLFLPSRLPLDPETQARLCRVTPSVSSSRLLPSTYTSTCTCTSTSTSSQALDACLQAQAFQAEAGFRMMECWRCSRLLHAGLDHVNKRLSAPFIFQESDILPVTPFVPVGAQAALSVGPVLSSRGAQPKTDNLIQTDTSKP